jgi:hypothetical protein
MQSHVRGHHSAQQQRGKRQGMLHTLDEMHANRKRQAGRELN